MIATKQHLPSIMNPWIENVARDDIPKRFHHDAGPNSMLIQIADPDMDFPEPKHGFLERHFFKFLDIEDKDEGVEQFGITDGQARQLVDLLQKALERKMNVVVHCTAGVCRSGAVTEVGVMMGFRDTERFRSPNLRVKHKMMKALGWTYDSEEPHTINGVPFHYDELNNKVVWEKTDAGIYVPPKGETP